MFCLYVLWFIFFCKQKTAYEMRISDWSSDVCSSDLSDPIVERAPFLPQVLDQPAQARRQTVALIGQNVRQAPLEDPAGLRHDDAPFQQDGPQQVDQCGAPPHPPLPHRWEATRAGKEGVRTVRTPWSPSQHTK